MSIALKLRRVVGAVTGLFFNTSCCCSCYMPWAIAKMHVASVDELFGQRHNEIMPCCRWCWQNSSSEQRLHLAGGNYGRLLAVGVTVDGADWKQIRDTVLCDGLNDWAEIERIVRSPA